MLRPAHCSVYLLCSQERRKKTHFFFFFPFSLQQIPLSFYFLHMSEKVNGCRSCSCLAEDKTSVLPSLTITSCSAQGPIFSSAQGPIFLLLQFFLERCELQEIFIGVMRDRRSIFHSILNADMELKDPV